MKAARLLAVGHMEVAEVPKPTPGPGDLLVRVEAVGVCGSDRHMFRGEYPTALPVTLGHEFAGIVELVGAGVLAFAPGMRVTGDPNISCGHCKWCAAGRPNLCPDLTAIGVFLGIHGSIIRTLIDWPPCHVAAGSSETGGSTAAASTQAMRRKPSGGMSVIDAVRSRPGFHTTVSAKPRWAGPADPVQLPKIGCLPSHRPSVTATAKFRPSCSDTNATRE